MRALAIELTLVVLALGPACTEPNPGYLPAELGSLCTPGERLCSGADLMVCVGGAPPRLELERVCPAPAVCQQGACLASGEPCLASCSDGLVCAVFAVPGVSRLDTYCVAPVGPTQGGEPCSKNEQCQSGLCIGGGKAPVCFRGCTRTRECPSGLRCQDVKLTVGGVAGTLAACVP